MKRLYDEAEDKIYIKWDPKFKIGIPVIDEQHEHLVNLCNDFYQSLLQNQDSERYRALIKETLEKCLNYAATHFKEEEPGASENKLGLLLFTSLKNSNPS